MQIVMLELRLIMNFRKRPTYEGGTVLATLYKLDGWNLKIIFF